MNPNPPPIFSKENKQKLLPLLQRLKEVYLLWCNYYVNIPKTHRYTLAQRIDDLFIASIESVATASFLSKSEKQPYVRLAIRKIDTLKVLLLVLWEAKSLDNKKYLELSVKIDEIGKMLGGWNGQLNRK